MLDDEQPEELDLTGVFMRRCLKHGLVYEDFCPVGDHQVRRWEVVDTRTGQAIFRCSDSVRAPVQKLRHNKVTGPVAHPLDRKGKIA